MARALNSQASRSKSRVASARKRRSGPGSNWPGGGTIHVLVGRVALDQVIESDERPGERSPVRKQDDFGEAAIRHGVRGIGRHDIMLLSSR